MLSTDQTIPPIPDPPATKYVRHERIQSERLTRFWGRPMFLGAHVLVVPKGCRIALSVRGRDYQYPGGAAQGLGNLNAVFTGVGPFRHNDARDRPAAVFGGDITLHLGPQRPAHLLLPVIPGG